MKTAKALVLTTMVIGIAILIGGTSFAQWGQDMFAPGQNLSLEQIVGASASAAEPMMTEAEPTMAAAEPTMATVEPMMVVAGPTITETVPRVVPAAGSWTNGYSGGCGGGEFWDSIPYNSKEVLGVVIRSGSYVDSLQMWIRLTNGQIVALPKHGGNGGAQSVFSLRSGEYITSMWGRYGSYVDSIQFRTNLGRVSPRYGGSGGCGNFYYSAPSGYEIAGFYGRAGAYIDAIGVVLRKH